MSRSITPSKCKLECLFLGLSASFLSHFCAQGSFLWTLEWYLIWSLLVPFECDWKDSTLPFTLKCVSVVKGWFLFLDFLRVNIRKTYNFFSKPIRSMWNWSINVDVKLIQKYLLPMKQYKVYLFLLLEVSFEKKWFF
jgi:hypothetical protein